MDARVALYRLIDAGGVLLYVGISDDVGRRWSQHLKQKTWWPQVHRQTVDWHPSRAAAEAAEAAAIQIEQPVHNVRHSVNPRPRVTQDLLSGGIVRTTAMELRRNWTDVVGRVAHAGRPVEVTKNGETAAYLISPALLERARAAGLLDRDGGA
jgi:prevent-host-death family protein